VWWHQVISGQGWFVSVSRRKRIPPLGAGVSGATQAPWTTGISAIPSGSVDKWVCRYMKYNREGAPDIPKCHITKSGQEPKACVKLSLKKRQKGGGIRGKMPTIAC